jgi:hypothetical protein
MRTQNKFFKRNLRNRVTYPRLNFLLDFIYDLGLIGVIVLAAHFFQYAIYFLLQISPHISTPLPIKSPLSHLMISQYLVTVTDLIALVVISINAIMYVTKIAIETIIQFMNYFRKIRKKMNIDKETKESEKLKGSK